MRILFVTAGAVLDAGSFPEEYVAELKKRCEVLHIHWDIGNAAAVVCSGQQLYCAPVPDFEAISPDMRIFEEALGFRHALSPLIADFEPDIIHCMGMRAFLPFRFDGGVVYSDWQDDDAGGYDAIAFQKLKIRRYALTASSASIVYSKGDARSAINLCGGKCAPLVLPAGIAPRPPAVCSQPFRVAPDFHKMADRISVLCIASSRGGAETFLAAIEQLGSGFKEKYALRYALTPAKYPSSFGYVGYAGANLVDCITAVPESCRTIVIIPYASGNSFWFDALKAMASASLLIIPRSEGAAAFAEYGENCLELSPGAAGMRDALVNAAVNFDSYAPLREQAARTGAAWSIERSVSAHLYVCGFLLRGKLPHLISAYTQSFYKTRIRFASANRAEKRHAADRELRALRLISDAAEKAEAAHPERWGRIAEAPLLALTGAYTAQDDFPNITVVSTLSEEAYGIAVRSECLPFADRAYPVVIAAGAWETVSDPCTALMEMQRIADSLLIILYRVNHPYSWQEGTASAYLDWDALNGTDFSYEAGHAPPSASEWDEQEANGTNAELVGWDIAALLRRIKEATGYRAAVFLSRKRHTLQKIAQYRTAEYATPP